MDKTDFVQAGDYVVNLRNIKMIKLITDEESQDDEMRVIIWFADGFDNYLTLTESSARMFIKSFNARFGFNLGVESRAPSHFDIKTARKWAEWAEFEKHDTYADIHDTCTDMVTSSTHDTESEK